MSHRLDATRTDAGTLLRLDEAWRMVDREPHRLSPFPAVAPRAHDHEAEVARAMAATALWIERTYGITPSRRKP